MNNNYGEEKKTVYRNSHLFYIEPMMILNQVQRLNYKQHIKLP